MKPTVHDKRELLNYFNERYAVIIEYSGRRWLFDIQRQARITFETFRNVNLNVHLPDGRKAADWWLRHPQRRTADFAKDLPNGRC